MAKIVEYFRCPTCKKKYRFSREALKCKNLHPVVSELWAEGSCKSVLIGPSGMSEPRALIEVDLPDNINDRARAIAKLKKERPELFTSS